MDFYFVNMPFAPLERPSLGIGLLQAILERNGISTAALHANILWCERTGMQLYRIARHVENQFGDWIFSEVAFPEFEPDSESYLRSIFTESVLEGLGIRQERLWRLLAHARSEAKNFIDEMARRIVDGKPLMVGCTTTFVAHLSSLALLKRVREISPDIVTMMGGANCESMMGLTTHEKFPWVDYVVSGEADGVIVDLVRAIQKKGRGVGLEELPYGVFGPPHRACDYEGLRQNPPRAVSESLEGLPTPIYDDYFAALRSAPTLGEVVHPGLPVEGSRGCWWGHKKQCAFCGLNGAATKYRYRREEEVLEDLKTLRDRHGVNRMTFADNILNPRWFGSLFNALRDVEPLFEICCETTPNLSRKRIEAMAQAGVRSLQPGIESLDPEVLVLLNKGTKAWINVRFLKWCLYYGIYPYWFLLDRVPGQDNAWYARTREIIPSLHHLTPPKLLNSILFSRFGKYHSFPDRYGLRLAPARGYSVAYPLTESELDMLACDFVNNDERAEEPDRMNSGTSSAAERQALIKDLVEWARLFRLGERPVLQVTDTGTELHVLDTRPAAVAESFRLSEEERAVYLACEEGIRPEKLYEKLSAEGVQAYLVEGIVSDLVAQRLLLLLDNHLLSLGTPEPLRELPEDDRHPGGWIDDALYDALVYVTGSAQSWQ